MHYAYSTIVTFLMLHPNFTAVLNIGTKIVTGASVLHTVLPPWDWQPEFVSEGLADFPNAQALFYGAIHNRYYKLLIYLIGWTAINARSTFWRSISIKNQLAPK